MIPHCRLLSLLLVPVFWAASGELPAPGGDGSSAGKPVLLFLGDSLTAGYGLSPSQAFPAIIQEKIEAAGWDFKVVNAGLSGETSAGGLRRIDWLLRQRIDVLVLELGANDALRGVAPPSTRQNLEGILDKVQQRYPEVKIVIAGMKAPANLGPRYTRQFQDLFSDLATSRKAALIPFLLEGVAGTPELNLPDGIHPTAEGHEIMAENVWSVLRPLLQEQGGR